MRKLIALLLAVGAVAAIVFFWRRDQQSWNSTWCSAKHSTSSWGKAAAHEAEKAADSVSSAADTATAAASNLADEVKDHLGKQPEPGA
jgi:hypothetical protein